MTNAWRTGHRLAWDVPRHRCTFLVQAVLAPYDASLRASLLNSSVGFFRGLLDTPSNEVTVVALLAARAMRSSLGSNQALVQEESGLNPWVTARAKLWAALEAANRVHSGFGSNLDQFSSKLKCN